MQWQRVLYGCGDAIENAGRVCAIYEFTLKNLPGTIVRVRIVETPEGQFFGVPDHGIQSDDMPQPICVQSTATHSPEKALQDAVCHFVEQIKPPYNKLRLFKLQNW
jgi:hypothetical protein